MFERIIKNDEELNAVALHLRTEGSLEELKELAKRWRIPKKDTEDFISGKRYRLVEIKIEDQEYTTPEEKLRVEMIALSDQYFADIIAGYMIKKCREEKIEKYILAKHKSLQKCLDYVMEKAYKIAEEQAKKKGQERIQQNVGLAFRETQVFEWAEEYYTRDDMTEEAKREEEAKNKIQKEWEKEEQRNKVKVKKTSNKKAAAGKKTEAKEKDENDSKQKQERKETGKADGQISMFDLLSNAS